MPAWATGRRRQLPRAPRWSPTLWLLVLGAMAGLAVFVSQGEAPFELEGGTLTGPVERVADGDTIEIGGQRIRLAGLDAPEWDQTCSTASGARWPCGREAAARMRNLVRGATLTCHAEGRDRYARLLARCLADEQDVAESLVREGLAVSSGRYRTAEAEARNAGRGLWQGAFVSPAEWRTGMGRDHGADGGNPSRFERFLAWLIGLFTG